MSYCSESIEEFRAFLLKNFGSWGILIISGEPRGIMTVSWQGLLDDL